MKKLAATKPAAARRQKTTALAKLIFPAGKWRPAVLGFSASNFRSAIRLKAMAQVLAQTMAARIKPNFFQPGQPRLSRAATAIAASAKGSAKAVWENLTNSAHFLILQPKRGTLRPAGTFALHLSHFFGHHRFVLLVLFIVHRELVVHVIGILVFP